MKKKIKYLFSLQLFGGGQAATSFDKTDLTPKNGMIDFKIGNNTYSIPEKAFENVGDYGGGHQTKTLVAAIFAAYWIHTGNNPKERGIPFELNGQTLYQNDNESILKGLKAWYKEQTGNELSIPTDYNPDNITELIADTDEMQRNLQAFLQSGAATINGQDYQTWSKTQPQLQPGYNKTLGVPVAQTNNGQYVYKNKDGSYVLSTGDALPEGVSLVNIYTGKPVQLGADGLLYDTETGALIKGFNESLPSAKEQAENDYYRDLFSREEGTLGADILANSTSLFEKEAANAQLVADTSMQQQALAQAQGIKQVTDSLRNERMSQLRAGMSESQLADRELSMLMSSVDTFNTQAQQSAQDSLTAQLGANTAREQAFNEYLTHAAQLGQTSAAMSASDAGAVNAVATQYFQSMQAAGTPVTMQQAWDYASGLTLAKTTSGS